jgi:hypothetical protein
MGTLKNRERLLKTDFVKNEYFPQNVQKNMPNPKFPMDHLQPTRYFTWPFLALLKKSSFLGRF